MNYLRGAVVNAISAPYQYYKDINPSTLTGAIDVIVIQRPAPDGDGTELACSPFHVRFGKWQVLRPAEKKVNVSVNGNPIPYNMKIGDAGEAFFVFETEDDVPEDLITSPILQATTPKADAEAVEAAAQASAKNERFAADPDQQGDQDHEEKLQETRAEEEQMVKNGAPAEGPIEEPEYLDLDGRPETRDDARNQHITPKPTYHVPTFLKKSSSRTTLNQSSFLVAPKADEDNSLHGNRTPEMLSQDQVVDEALRAMKREGHIPEVDYHNDVALDMEGYHSEHHGRGRSDETIRSSDFEGFNLPPSEIPLYHSTVPATPAGAESDSPNDMPQGSSSKQFPLFRATSEPPPDVHIEPPLLTIPEPGHSASELLTHSQLPHSATRHQHQQEYMWEWGHFPQPSPMKTTFSKGGRLESPRAPTSRAGDRWRTKTKTVQVRNGRLGGMRLPILEDSDEEGEDEVASEEVSRGRTLGDDKHGRSHSVPPQSNTGSSSSLTTNKRDRRRWKEYEDFDEAEEDEFSRESRLFKDEGGSLMASKGDPTKFILSIEGQKVGFQLSLAGLDGLSLEAFRQHLVYYDQFLDDDSIISNPALVMRWVGVDQYITRSDSPPLMDALAQWRATALQRRACGQSLRPVSPGFSEDSLPTSPVSETSPDSPRHPEKRPLSHMRAKSEPPEEGFQDDDEDRKASNENQQSSSSYSWVPWFRSSRKKDAQRSTKESPARSEEQNVAPNGAPPVSKADAITEAVENIPVNDVKHDEQPVAPVQEQQAPVKKKYAKTLRLTSNQLKALNLQPGPNTITFSLSATGGVAATARIFVWEHTDLVVVSDIDGTITKSDGLGHVFAMIGRDWTHLGVAKLYTDITRNGYKIMYLTSRAIGQADATRGYLKGIKQNNYQLPEGPVIMSPDRLMASLHREVVLRKPEVFKMACLRDIQRLFGEHNKYPFYAGFGNRITDALSYRTVNIPSARIFTIDSAGEVKMELLELAGYKSSYIHMTDLVDQMFPPIHKKWTPEYTDFNYWRAPVQDFPLPDFSPPSPALSARSETSNQSALARLRNFSLVGSRQANQVPNLNGNKQQEINRDDEGNDEGYRSNHLRQMSSFERLSSTLGFMNTVNGLRRSASPEPLSDDYDSEDDDEATLSDGAYGRRRRRRERRRSMTSMPGSLMDEEEEMHFSDNEDDHEYDDEAEHGGEEGDVVEEEAFDEDILAAGEMSKVPFL